MKVLCIRCATFIETDATKEYKTETYFSNTMVHENNVAMECPKCFDKGCLKLLNGERYLDASFGKVTYDMIYSNEDIINNNITYYTNKIKETPEDKKYHNGLKWLSLKDKYINENATYLHLIKVTRNKLNVQNYFASNEK